MMVRAMASKRRLRRKSCQGKYRHPDKDSAYAARRAVTAQDEFYKGHMNVYKCKFCKGWHIGRAPQR